MGFDILLFDFGGTLDGPGEPWLQRFDRCYRACGVVLPRPSLSAAFGNSTRRCYADPGMAGRRLRATIACHVAWQAEHLALPDATPVEAVIDTFVAITEANLEASRRLLERWSARARLGVISNFYGNVHLLLDDAGITPLLGAVVDSTVVGVAKPDPRIFALALERLGGKPARALYVGDSHDKDVLGARSAGLHTAWLPGDDGPGDVRHAADFVLGRLEDVEDLLG
jgi:putative hydrolase of the HAD superfamily